MKNSLTAELKNKHFQLQIFLKFIFNCYSFFFVAFLPYLIFFFHCFRNIVRKSPTELAKCPCNYFKILLFFVLWREVISTYYSVCWFSSACNIFLRKNYTLYARIELIKLRGSEVILFFLACNTIEIYTGNNSRVSLLPNRAVERLLYNWSTNTK